MKENIYCHNLRLNLDIQEQLNVHGFLMQFDKDKYKSKNAFMVEVIKAGMEKMTERVEKSVLPDEQMKLLEGRITERIRKDVLNEVLKTLLGMAVQPGTLPIYREREEVQEDTHEEPINPGLATVALGYFEE